MKVTQGKNDEKAADHMDVVVRAMHDCRDIGVRITAGADTEVAKAEFTYS